MTATPDRPDGKSVLAFFQDSSHRMTLEEAVRKGELVPIRCVRVKTNIDLSRVRFNQVQYNPRDIENSVMIPDRDDLVVRTYLDHCRKGAPSFSASMYATGSRWPNAFATTTCLLLRSPGVTRSSGAKRRFRHSKAGSLQVLCACDILNEGWDCPAVEALFMARPTLSKILYLQQLGRGTRKSPDTGKKCLYVFDFVDNAGRYNAALSLHRVAGKKTYRPGALVLAPDGERNEEEFAFRPRREAPCRPRSRPPRPSITRRWTSSTGRRRSAA